MNAPTDVIIMTDAQAVLIVQFDAAVTKLLEGLMELASASDAAQIVENVLMTHAVNIAALGYSRNEDVRAFLLRVIDWRLSRGLTPPFIAEGRA